jgi:hypothetical protein
MTRAPILLCLASVLLAPPVRAAGSAEDRVAADALYTQAGDLMKAEHFAEACPKLETSQRLDPGVGTLLRLGFCYEHIGRTASAMSAYNDAEVLARAKPGDKRADDAAARAKALEPRLSRLLILSANAAPGQEVRRDGKLVDAGILGTAVPVDPGEHVIEVSAPGRQSWKTSAHVNATPETTTVAVPVLPIATEAPVVSKPAAPYWNGQRVAGAVVGGAGLVGIIVGAVFGAQTFSKNNASMPYCPTVPTMCYPPGVTLRNDAYSASTISTLGFVVGGVAIAGGAVTFFTATKRPAIEVQPAAGPGVASMSVRGSW